MSLEQRTMGPITQGYRGAHLDPRPWGALVAVPGPVGLGPLLGCPLQTSSAFTVSCSFPSSGELWWLRGCLAGLEKIFIIVNKLARARPWHLMERVMSGNERGRLSLPRACLKWWMWGLAGWGGWRCLCFQRQGIFSQGMGLVETGSEQITLHFFSLLFFSSDEK